LFAGALLLSPGSRNLRGRSGTRRLEDLFPRAERSHVEGAGVRRPTALIRPRTRRQRLHTNAITLPAAWTVPSSCRRSRKLRRSEQRTATRARPQAQRRLTWLAWELSLLPRVWKYSSTSWSFARRAGGEGQGSRQDGFV